MHTRTKSTLLQPSDEVIETLEDNQVQLQNMLTSKYIAHFANEVCEFVLEYFGDYPVNL